MRLLGANWPIAGAQADPARQGVTAACTICAKCFEPPLCTGGFRARLGLEGSKKGHVMRLVTLYVSTAIVFFAVDVVMLASYMTPLFREHIGHLMASPIRGGPAALFYVGYLGAVLYLASWPAVKASAARMAILPGAVLGLASYGTYEFTSYAILADWHIQMLISDTIWGGVLTGFSAWAGAAITLRFAKQKGPQAG